jgi:hypothetical protein
MAVRGLPLCGPQNGSTMWRAVKERRRAFNFWVARESFNG